MSISSEEVHIFYFSIFHAVKRAANERQCIFKSKAPEQSGAFALEVQPPLERMSVLFAAFRSSHVIVV